MNLLEQFKVIFSDGIAFENTKNFYFEHHICEKSGNNEKVDLKFKIAYDGTDKIIKLGMCEKCKKVFYNKNFESKSF